MLALPRADHLQEHLVLGFLYDGEGCHERLAQHIHQRVTFAEQDVVDRFVITLGRGRVDRSSCKFSFITEVFHSRPMAFG